MLKRPDRSIALPILWFLGILLGFWFFIQISARSLWFAEVGYPGVFLQRLGWQIGLAIGSGTLSLWFIFGNLRLAERLKWPDKPIDYDINQKDGDRAGLIPQSSSIPLWGLLFIALGIGAAIIGMLGYYTDLAIDVWTPKLDLPNLSASATSTGSGIIEGISAIAPWNTAILAPIAFLTLLLLIRTKITIEAIALLFCLLFAGMIAGNWTNILKSIDGVPFHQIDPQFGRDIGFYIFQLPVWQLLESWLGGLGIYTLFAVTLTYLFSADSLSRGKFPGLSRPQLRHLYGLWGGLMTILVFHHVIGRYLLLYSPDGVIYGAGYTDIHVRQFIEIALGTVAGITAIRLFWKAITGAKKRGGLYRPSKKRSRISPYLRVFFLYVIISIGGWILGAVIQRAIVQPNELARERPYIERGIAATRAAFGLEKIHSIAFDPKAELSPEVLDRNYLTVDNIRLWDTKPLLETNRQLQQIRLYYKFPDADYDRYEVKVKPERQLPDREPSEKQQTIIAARELDYSAIPVSANTWVNERLVYTHGYGFTLSPVNLVGEGGLPYYFVKDIGTEENQGDLRVSSEMIRYSIPIARPRIYYGELTDNYVMTPTKVEELDFPSGEGNVYTTYSGSGGIPIGSPWRRWLFALYLRDWQMLLTRDFTPETKVLMDRNILRRVHEIAPFLRFDRNPYLVAADVGKNNNKLHWIIDAYTISDRYPYSDPGKDGFNYIRNSVKVVVDAYNGSVDFYVADPDDPIARTWSRIFPHLFKSLAEMPPTLRAHIRYPEDFFSTQSERLLTYHMTDPQVFYNREDQWEIPREIYGNQPQEVKPYYLIMKFPDAPKEEFILLHPYTPSGRQNLIAWLAARSDDTEYGNLLLYRFPKQRLIYGPNQIEALINQDPEISQQISLWNREGSRVLQGHLLVIPIERSLLYVEPLYLVAEQNSVPTIARVTVAYQNRVVMAPTLREALDRLFP
ncbi:UPF0182 family protein [Pannus brasiliensis CCIBt3594]|uniref:UPF0182 protein V0288_21850 n=1 Tax=Pannus brasiliensis CCIBt3594 TaxID=1427578 RepID=A0AAW9QPS5_9CHRO